MQVPSRLWGQSRRGDLGAIAKLAEAENQLIGRVLIFVLLQFFLILCS